MGNKKSNTIPAAVVEANQAFVELPTVDQALVDLMTAIDTRIEALAERETVTKADIGELPMLIIPIVWSHGFIGKANQLLDAITPSTRKWVGQMFKQFLPYKWDKEAGKFGGGKIAKKTVVTAKQDDWLKWSANNDNAWAYYDMLQQGKPKGEPKFREALVRATKNALTGRGEEKEGQLTVDECIAAIMEGGIEAPDLLARIADLQIIADAANEAAASEATIN